MSDDERRAITPEDKKVLYSEAEYRVAKLELNVEDPRHKMNIE